MPFTKPENLSVQVAKHLAQKIITGEYLPGSRIMEANIATDLQISRGPIREALLILQRQKLVTILPRRGALITELSAKHIEELYDVVSSLFHQMAKTVAKHWQDEQLLPLENELLSMQKCASQSDVAGFFQHNKQLVTECLTLCQNELLTELIQDLLPSLDRIHYHSLQTRQSHLLDIAVLFENILGAIRLRDLSQLNTLVDGMHAQEKEYALEALAE